MASAYASKLLLHLRMLSWGWDHGTPTFLNLTPQIFPHSACLFLMTWRWCWRDGLAEQGSDETRFMFQKKHSAAMWVGDGQYETQKIYMSYISLSSQHLGQCLAHACLTNLLTNIMPISAQSPPWHGKWGIDDPLKGGTGPALPLFCGCNNGRKTRSLRSDIFNS